MTRDQIRSSVSDLVALIATLYGEASGEPIEGQIAAACVIRNRVKADIRHDNLPDWWGEGYRGVCLKRLQFSCWWETNDNSDRVYALAERFITRQPVGAGVVAQLQWVAEGIINDVILDRSKGADHYLTTALLRSSRAPIWARNRNPVAVIGAHSFFRLET